MYDPVTGTPCCWGYLAARKKSGLADTMPNAPLDSALCTPVTTSVGLVWSSTTSGTSLCPFTPPSAFWSAIRAKKPAGSEEVSGALGPVSDVTNARVIGAGEAEADGVLRLSVASAIPTAPATTPEIWI